MTTGRRNVGEFANHETVVNRPKTMAELTKVIRSAAETNKQLHPFSTGHNWGLGSSVPLGPRPVSLQLSEMKAIREIDLDAGWAIVEPGVTQADMTARLAGTCRMLNVTASTAQASVLGNALDRGVGLRGQRTNDLLGLEIVTADAITRRVGWWPHTIRHGIAPYRYGTGPDLLGLFSQSNLAAVSAGTIALLPRPEATAVIRSTVSTEDLTRVLRALGTGLATGMINAVPKLYSPGAHQSYSGTGRLGDAFTLYVAVDGTAASIAAKTEIALDHLDLSPGTTQKFNHPRDLPRSADLVTRLVVHGYHGDVSSHDSLVAATLGVDPPDVDKAGRGWLFFLPLIPTFNDEVVRQAYELISQVTRTGGPTIGATANLLTPDLVDFVVSIAFDRKTQTRDAHRTLDLLHDRFQAIGLVPYRLDVDHPLFSRPDGEDTDLVRAIRRAIDPFHRFENGRYLPNGSEG